MGGSDWEMIGKCGILNQVIRKGVSLHMTLEYII